MTKKFIASALVLGCANLYAQIPENGNFETWVQDTYETITYENIAGKWDNGSFCANTGVDATCSFAVEKSTDAYEGDYAAKIIEGGFFGLSIMDYPIEEIPNSLSFYADFTNLPDLDTCFAVAVFVHYDKLMDDEGDSDYEIGNFSGHILKDERKSQSGYNKYSFDISELQSLEAGTFKYITVFMLFDDKDEDIESSVLIDNFVFETNEAIHTDKISDPADDKKNTIQTSKLEFNQQAFTVSPNPADDVIHFATDTKSFQIITLTGKSIVTGSGNSADISQLPSGIYKIKAELPCGKITESFFIKK